MIFLGRCRGVMKLEDAWRQNFSIVVFYLCLQVSEMEVNGQFESVCESVFSELESQAVEALDLPMPGCFRMRSHSYVRAIEKGCSQDDECVSLRSSSPPRTTTTVRTIQSSTGEWHPPKGPHVTTCWPQHPGCDNPSVPCYYQAVVTRNKTHRASCSFCFSASLKTQPLGTPLSLLSQALFSGDTTAERVIISIITDNL